MRFKWAGTEPISLTLGEETRVLTGGWWEVYEILALMLGMEGKAIPAEYLRTSKGRGIELPEGDVLNTNLCFDDVIPRIRKLAELLGWPCSVKWTNPTKGTTDTLVLTTRNVDAELENILDELSKPPTLEAKTKIVVVVFDSDTVRRDPDLVQATLQSIIG